MTGQHQALFHVGQLIHHRLFDYRGVIFDVDPVFSGTEEWYLEMSRSRSPKDKPWYHVLVHEGVHSTYVAERNLEPDDTGQPVHHPLVADIFDGLTDGAYRVRQSVN